MAKNKVYKAKDYLNSKQPTLIHEGVKHLNCGIDLVTDLVTIKNLETGKYKEVNFYKL